MKAALALFFLFTALSWAKESDLYNSNQSSNRKTPLTVRLQDRLGLPTRKIVRIGTQDTEHGTEEHFIVVEEFKTTKGSKASIEMPYRKVRYRVYVSKETFHQLERALQLVQSNIGVPDPHGNTAQGIIREIVLDAPRQDMGNLKTRTQPQHRLFHFKVLISAAYLEDHPLGLWSWNRTPLEGVEKRQQYSVKGNRFILPLGDQQPLLQVVVTRTFKDDRNDLVEVMPASADPKSNAVRAHVSRHLLRLPTENHSTLSPYSKRHAAAEELHLLVARNVAHVVNPPGFIRLALLKCKRLLEQIATQISPPKKK